MCDTKTNSQQDKSSLNNPDMGNVNGEIAIVGKIVGGKRCTSLFLCIKVASDELKPSIIIIIIIILSLDYL